MTKVKCKAKCRYQHKGLCFLDEIEIGIDEGEPCYCDSFKII